MEKKFKGDDTMGISPMMQQYYAVKEKCPDCILFFRVGDFYEMFFDDAILASRELELVLTGKDCGLTERAPMCGIPYHACDSYIARLVNKGYKVAIGEQLEDPAAAKGIVKRGIIKIVTPGTLTDSAFLEEKKNNYLMSLFMEDSKSCGLSFSDISTGEFYATFAETDLFTKELVSLVVDEASKYNPREILIAEGTNEDLLKALKERFNISYTLRTTEFFKKDSEEVLKAQFTNYDSSIKNAVKYASSGLLSYILETQKINLSNISSLEYYDMKNYLLMDINSRRNLELTETMRDKTKKGSLLHVLDKTVSSMGGRKLRKWVERPLVSIKDIENRLDAIEELTLNYGLLCDLREGLSKIYDIERIISKISTKSVNPRELVSLKNSIKNLPEIYSLLQNTKSKYLSCMYSEIDLLEDVYLLLEKAILDNPSITSKEGDIIKEGYSAEVDELKMAKKHGKEWIASLELKEREETSIKSLKVSYNKVFGYYIEVTNANLSLVPEGRYIRKQTLTNGERFITPELKEMEDKILGAQEKLINLEYSLFVEVRDKVEQNVERMKKTSDILSSLDALSSLALVAIENNFKRPKVTLEGELSIKEGRHPVVEKVIGDLQFVANDTLMDMNENKLLLITGPNMAGKSTYMRQVALITLMAQMGSFVPAKEATIPLCDRIFTRIGASDDLSAGKSTFMVEMWEVSNILKNSTSKSLVLLDEVGRGTSTYDGLSIAWAVIEYMSKNKEHSCKTLFATHYHELIKLEGKVPGVLNYSIAVKRTHGEISFLRKIVRGGADESYGIEVAKLSGIPVEVTDRAREILKSLEEQKDSKDNINTDTKAEAINAAAYEVNEVTSLESSSSYIEALEEKDVCTEEVAADKDVVQMDFTYLLKDQLIEDIKSIDVLNMTPMDGFNKLFELVKKAKTL